MCGMWFSLAPGLCKHSAPWTPPCIAHTTELDTNSKVMLKIIQARLEQCMNRELPDVQAGFRKGRGTDIKLATSAGSWKKQESSRKASLSSLLTMPIL